MINQNLAVEIKNLSVNFGDKNVLKNINLDIERGSIVAYIGKNGAGKSTTVKTLLGLIKDFNGEVFVLGENVLSDNKEYKKKIGYVAEVVKLYECLTAREYLTFVGQIYGLSYEVSSDKSERLMEVLGIKDSIDKQISSFSKGMKQKVVIISSLLHNPEILFLDEPLSGLDANSVVIVKEIISKLKDEGKTIFYSSHILEVVEKISDRIIILNEGNIICDGDIDTIKSLQMKDSLEEVFNEVTGFNEAEKLANDFIDILKEGI